ncbi:Ger(x)C family spore germination protein [Peribacillus sp. SI8-4]|uniref:Ger(x)C family spore germination protein n=1 Tax=Peribacillus sp. SI8-4 TaxID=3048009 RepID=UPI00255667A2|nr:Ger(x)C family spore germination protein [Peribacillus sp. SI8-4]
MIKERGRVTVREKVNRHKSISIILLLLLTIPFMSGCWDRVEINDLAIVTAASIDKKDDGSIELSIQVFIPKSISSGGGEGGPSQGAGGATTLVKSDVGSNLSEALSKLQGKVPRKVFWGHCKVFVFGEGLAKEGIQEQLDFLLRHPQPRERANVYVSKGKGKAILESLPPLENYSGEVIKELSDLHLGLRVTLHNLDEMLTGNSQAVALPFIKILPPAKGEAKLQGIPYIFGTALFERDKMTGTMTEKETRGLLWLKDDMESYTVTLKPEGIEGLISINPISSRVRIIPYIVNGNWRVSVKVDTEGTVIQNGTKLNLTVPKSLKIAERTYQKDVEKRIRLTLLHLQGNGDDVIGLAKEFYRKYPKQFSEAENDWERIFEEMEVEVDVTSHIRRQGYINKPAGLPEKEVKDR